MSIPAFGYPGGKSKAREWVCRQFPAGARRYVEPFAGRGNVFWLAAHRFAAAAWWLNDLRTAPWLEIVRDVGGRGVPDVYPTRDDYARWCNGEGGTVAALLCEPMITFCGSGYGKGYSPASRKGGTVDGLKRRTDDAAAILRAARPRITAWDWTAVEAELGPGDFAYFDPPYRGTDVRAYRANLDYDRLAAALRDSRYCWVLTEYDRDFYTPYLGEPVAARVVAVTVSHTNDGPGVRVEYLWAKLMA